MAEANGSDKKTFKPGDDVQVVLASGRLEPAKITKVNRNGTADLIFTHNGQEVQITSSPFDPTGKKPDCFCAAAGA